MTAGAWAWVSLAIACGGCGRIGFDPNPNGGIRDAADGDATVAGGSRLRLERWVAPDGESQFADFYDTLFDTRCKFSADNSGTLRCFPVQSRGTV